jgi:peptidoglycan hydrolase CwlO-like protein
MSMRLRWLALLGVLLAGLARAQDPSPALKLEAHKIAIQRAREATAKCEDDLASLWAQANALQKEHQATRQELDKLKQEVEGAPKQPEGTPPHVR